MKKDTKVELIPLSAIRPDENQPRKNFDASRLADLIASIKAHGIITPLVVEELGGGKYQLVDGERRFRAAQEIKLKEVPSVVVEQMSNTDRLVQQFHIQEQHQSWTAIEKAVAVASLASQLKLTLREVARMLALPPRTISDYIGFANLVDRSSFEKSEIGLSWASPIVAINTYVRRAWEKANMDFDMPMQKALQNTILHQIKSGDIKRVYDLQKIRDAVKMNPKFVERYIKGRLSLNRLFIESDGKKAFLYRNIINNSRFLVQNMTEGQRVKVEDFFTEENQDGMRVLKLTHERLTQFAKKVGAI